MTSVQTLILLALLSDADVPTTSSNADELRFLEPVEMRSAYSGELREASFTFVSKEGDLIDVRVAVDQHEQLAKKLTVSHRKASVSISPKLLKCIPNPDPRSIVLILGYVNPKLSNSESIAYMDIAFEWHQGKPGKTGVSKSAASDFAVHILDGEVMWAEVVLPGEKRFKLKPDGNDCDFVREL